MSEERKERVSVSDEEFLKQYKVALAGKVKLSDFAIQINQAEGTVNQRVSRYNKILKGYAPRFEAAGMEVPKLGYLSQGDGTGKRGKKALTPVELIELLGLKLDSPV